MQIGQKNGTAGYFCAMNWKFIIWSVLFVLLLGSCANIQGISGGPDDLAPPQRVAEGSSPNLQTEFKDREITFVFNEWFRLDNPNSHIQIAPSTEYPLSFKLRGKSLVVGFDEKEILKPNTTYILQLGASIKDITKGNVAQNIQYVFSTGLFIDSLSIKGSVMDGFTGDPQKQTLVCLYLEPDDSLFRTRKPYYYGYTDAGGQFELKHLSPGNYSLYALGDKNYNFYFDQPSEPIAFLDQRIQLRPGQVNDPFVLKTHLQRFLLNAKEIIQKPGHTSLVFNRKPIGPVTLSTNSDRVQFVQAHDSLRAWNFSSTPQVLTLKAENFYDTLIIKPLTALQTDSAFHLKLTSVSISPEDPIRLMSEYPICEIVDRKAQSQDSAVRIETIELDTQDSRVILLKGRWHLGTQFSIQLNGGIFKNCFGQLNAQDTLRIFSPPLNSYATLILELDSIPVPTNAIFQLLRNNILIAEKVAVLQETFSNITFKYLPAGTYRLRVISDLNQNNQWDGSDLQNKKQAEPVNYFNLPELRADWEVKAKIKL